MMRRALMIPVLAISASCAAGPSPAEILSRPAPSLASVIERFDASAVCIPSVSAPAAPSPHFVDRLVYCAPIYPAEMGQAGISAACTTMFDLDDGGTPIRIESRCAVDGALAPAPPAWLDVAEKAIAHSVQSLFAQYRYAPLSEGDMRPRSNLSQVHTFPVMGGRECLNPPRKFARPPPAPVPPPFVVEREGPGCPAY